MEGRLSERIDESAKALEGRLNEQLTGFATAMIALEDRLNARIDESAKALEDRLTERICDTETTLLTEFHKWASPVDLRARSHAAAIKAMDA
jgi:hypothetical protein